MLGQNCCLINGQWKYFPDHASVRSACENDSQRHQKYMYGGTFKFLKKKDLALHNIWQQNNFSQILNSDCVLNSLQFDLFNNICI